LSWGPDSRALYFIGRTQGVANVWMIDVDPTTLAVTGGPFRLTTMAQDNSNISVSRTGVMVFGARSGNSVVLSYPLDPSGRPISGTPMPLTAPELQVVAPDVTPDGRTLVFSIRRPGGVSGQELHVQTVGSTDRILFVSDSTRGEYRTQPRISPFGSHVAYRYISPDTVTPAGTQRIEGPQRIRVADTATGDEMFLNSLAEGYDLPGGWSTDGQAVLSAGGRGRYEPGKFSIACCRFPRRPPRRPGRRCS
jgi:Tol biopolymer transport system component